MPTSIGRAIFHFAALLLFVACGFAPLANAQGSSGMIEGVITDPTGAVVPDATIEISYSVSGYHRETISGAQGEFRFSNIPFNSYHLTATAPGFGPFVTDVDVRSPVPVAVTIGLSLTTTQTVTVQGEAKDLIENEPGFHTDIDRGLFAKLPLESQSSSVSSLVTLASPGVVADSNGLFHGLGDHAENSFSVDGQPISDQLSKVFSNQIPVDSIQSLEVISGAPPAEYGDKTSLVIKVTTRSGLGQKKPTGSFTTSYGSFGSSTANFDMAYGGDKWGNFVSIGGLNTGRFLDPPEFTVMHAKGNEENFFDHVDGQLTDKDSLHFNFGYSRSWFQEPNSFDAEAIGQDQRVKIRTFNVSPSWTHLFSPETLLNVVTYVRRMRSITTPVATRWRTSRRRRRRTGRCSTQGSGLTFRTSKGSIT